MGLFEIIGELFNPGPVGQVNFNDNEYKIREKFVHIRFAISIAIIGFVEYFFLGQSENYTDICYIAQVNGILILYLLISNVVAIQPDYDNLGWVPFLINNPFRISDNFNRTLALLKTFFMPGKYVFKSVVEFFEMEIE